MSLTRCARARISNDRRLDLRAKRSLLLLGLGHLLTERGDLGVHGLLALDDRVRARRSSGHNGEHEHESRTADHAAAFAGRRATPARALLERLHRPGSLGPQRRDRERDSPRPTPCPCGGRARAPSARRAHGLAPRRAPAAPFPARPAHRACRQRRPRPARGGTAAPHRRRRPRRGARRAAAPTSMRSCLRRDGALVALGEAAALSRIRPESDHGPGEEHEPRHPDQVDERLHEHLEVDASVGVHLVGDDVDVLCAEPVRVDGHLARHLLLGGVAVLPRFEPADQLPVAVDVDVSAYGGVVRPRFARQLAVRERVARRLQ